MLKRMMVVVSWIPICGVVASAAVLVPLLAGGAALVWAGVGAVVALVGLAVLGRRWTLPGAIGAALVLFLAAFGGGGGLLAGTIAAGWAVNVPDPAGAAIVTSALALALAARRQPLAPWHGAGTAIGAGALLMLALRASGVAALPGAMILGALAGTIVLGGAAAHELAGAGKGL